MIIIRVENEELPDKFKVAEQKFTYDSCVKKIVIKTGDSSTNLAKQKIS